jgi:type I restriction enzyme M protein
VDNDEIKTNDYTLSVNEYVHAEEIDTTIDIQELKQEIAAIVEREQKLRVDIEAIIAEIEGEGERA